MKVILLQDVAKIGRKHAVVKVPDGYGQNQLIPKGLAKPATPENLKLVTRIQAEKGAKQTAFEATFFETKKALEGTVISLPGRKHDHGHLFAAIKPEEIVAAAALSGITINQTMIRMNAPIKTAGEHRIGLVFGPHQTEFIINIT